MTIDFFVKSFDFKDLDLLNIELKNHILKVDVAMESHLDLIANGYRPELDVVIKKSFIFKNVDINNYAFSMPYTIDLIKYNMNELVLNICGVIVDIKASNVEIIAL